MEIKDYVFQTHYPQKIQIGKENVNNVKTEDLKELIMIINNINVVLTEMSFEDLVFILKDQEKRVLEEFIDKAPLYLAPENFFTFINFVAKNDKMFLEKLKIIYNFTIKLKGIICLNYINICFYQY